MFEWVKTIFGPPKLRTVSVHDLEPYQWGTHDGTKFPGGFGPTLELWTDYWTLRRRSAQLFKKNLYARGLIRRLVSNEINVGLHLEATPEEGILGYPEDGLATWAEETENRFQLWCDNPAICDENERLTLGALQAAVRREALVDGDLLIVMRQDPRTKLPRVQLISGESVQTPMHKLVARPGENRVVHGVELDGFGRQVAYWVRQPDLTSKRLPAFGEKTGRRLAWLVYGTDKRHGEVRGEPLLALILQSLQELDRYRDAALRKAVINSLWAFFIKKTADKAGSRPVTSGAVRKGVATSGSDGGKRSFPFVERVPGGVMEELQVGEEPVPFSNAGTDINFGEFEESIVQTIAWANNIPPEILRLAFSSNYSASQAAINEFKIYLNLVRTDFGEQFCKPIYVEWLIASVVSGKVKAAGLLEAFRDFSKHDVWGAWVAADWSGQIKPAVDLTKLVTGHSAMCEQGFETRDRASREINGTKFSKNVKKLGRENQQLAKALEPLLGILLKATVAAADDAAKPTDAPEDEDDKSPEKKPEDGGDDEAAEESLN
ncbi:MAG TPA: phage portal protein [Polyangiaceae bacterium]